MNTLIDFNFVLTLNFHVQACLKLPETMSSIDHKVVPLPWNERLFCPSKKRLKIGYYTDDGYFPLTPACKRAVEVSKVHTYR